MRFVSFFVVFGDDGVNICFEKFGECNGGGNVDDGCDDKYELNYDIGKIGIKDGVNDDEDLFIVKFFEILENIGREEEDKYFEVKVEWGLSGGLVFWDGGDNGYYVDNKYWFLKVLYFIYCGFLCS